MTRLIAVTGAVGAGATTLAQRLVELKGWIPAFEVNVETENPFFSRYHAEPSHYAFHNQVAFLTQSLQAHSSMCDRMSTDIHIQDFTPFEHVEVYAYVQREFGWLTRDEYNLVRRLAAALEQVYVAPAVLVYRELSVADVQVRVVDRGRPSEQALSKEFLEAVLARFESWVGEWGRCPVVRLRSDIDVREDTRTLSELTDQIDHALRSGVVSPATQPSS